MSGRIYDPHLPNSLQITQEWFGSIISRPIDDEHRMMPISPLGKPMAVEAPRYICASPTLQPHQRIEIYNQQYWWRLLKILQENLPFVTRLFGSYDFNETLGKPYLTQYPANHWSLNHLGYRMPQWIRRHYREKDKRLVLDAALIDCAYLKCFTAAQLPSLSIPKTVNADFFESLLNQTLYHQPHLFLFLLKKQLFQFRDQFVDEKETDHWLTQDFPPMLEGRLFPVVLFRSHFNLVIWKEISVAEYTFLNLFKKGCSVSKSVEWLETQEEAIAEEIAIHLRQWLQEWISLGWLATKR